MRIRTPEPPGFASASRGAILPFPSLKRRFAPHDNHLQTDQLTNALDLMDDASSSAIQLI